jgi:hypothetical protein
MSAALAYARPQSRHQSRPEVPQPRHLEIAPTRAQRRARPRSVYAITAVSTVFGLLLAQLVLSIVLSDGAFQISDLQAQQKSLSRTQGDLAEKLDLLASPQSLATKAEGMGMVLSSSTPVFLTLSDGSTMGSARPTSASARGVLGSKGGLVPNSLLTSADETGSLTNDDSGSSAPSVGSAAPSVGSTSGKLPSPNTR